jgi:hypothetical protein
MKLDEVIPWGRSFDEYRRMFALTGDDLAEAVPGCGDGPASFNAEATALALPGRLLRPPRQRFSRRHRIPPSGASLSAGSRMLSSYEGIA